MRFLKLFRLSKRRDRTPIVDTPAAAGEKKDEAGEVSDGSSGERKGETGEGSEIKTEMEEEEASERKRRIDDREEGPPVDDCCPICFGDFNFPCRALCGHWYCGDCILQYWNHGSALKPCKCPMCSRPITRLIPEASLDHCQEVDVLQNVRKYNRLFVGGAYGLVLKVCDLPFLLKRLFLEMMDPDAVNNHICKLRLLAMLLGFLYYVFHFDFLPAGPMDAINFFDNSAIALALILYVIGLYRRWRRLRLVRQFAAGGQPGNALNLQQN